MNARQQTAPRQQATTQTKVKPQTSATPNLDAVVTATEKALTYTPMGETDEIELTDSIVFHRLVKPSKAGIMPDKRDRDRFRMLCATRKLNPYAGACFLVGYDNKSGGADWSMIVAIDAYYKRAERSPQYDGEESGVIVQQIQTGAITERAGDVVMPGEKLLGGWAKIYRKDRRIPLYRSVKLEAFQKTTDFWRKDSPGMIRKTAQKAGFREAFPNEVGSLYTAEFAASEEPQRGEYKEVGLSPGLRAVVEATAAPVYVYVYDEAEAAAEAIQEELAADPVTVAGSQGGNLVQTTEGCSRLAESQEASQMIDPLTLFRASMKNTLVVDRIGSKLEEFLRECPEFGTEAQEIAQGRRFEIESAKK